MQHFITTDYKQDNNVKIYEELYSTVPMSAMTNVLLSFYGGTYAGLSFDDSINGLTTVDDDTKQFVSFIKNTYYSGEDDKKAFISILHFIYLYHEWDKKRQVYKFDRDLIQELSNTESDFSIPCEVFARLPYRTLYIDFSANPEICNLINADGCIVKPSSIDIAFKDGVHRYFVLLITTYKDGHSVAVRGITIPNKADGITMKAEDLCVNIDRQSEATGDAYVQTALIMQTLLYLCSYEPDVRETAVSKAKVRDAKKKKTPTKPIREYVVGERFGTAFRKWTAGRVGEESNHTETGRHVRPHVRRAHWHRYWTGKKDSNDRKLIIKWTYECFCGTNNNEELDTVKHKVKE